MRGPYELEECELDVYLILRFALEQHNKTRMIDPANEMNRCSLCPKGVLMPTIYDALNMFVC